MRLFHIKPLGVLTVVAVIADTHVPRGARRLPDECVRRCREADLGSVRIGVVHIPGPRAGREGRLAARFAGCAAVVYGHTHVPQVERVGGVWILNPGSPTERRSAPFHSMLEVRVSRDDLVPELIRIST